MPILIKPPESDMLVVNRSSNRHRQSILNFAPPHLNIVNYSVTDVIDKFFIDCQNQRDYCRDMYDKLSRPLVFKKHYGKCGFRYEKDKTPDILQIPRACLRQYHPITCPIYYGREMQLEEGIRLGGQYTTSSCISFKR